MSEGLLNKVRAYFFLPPGVFGQGALLHLAGYLLMPLVTGAPAGKAALPENTALPENASLPDEASFADIVMERLAGLPGDLLSYAALPKTVPGLLLFAAGMAAALLALNPFLKYRISPHPLSRTPHRLFTAGIYSLSRNPMYLSLLLMLAGLGVMLSPWLLPVTLPYAFFFLRRQILREERFLKETSPEYQDYLRTVPRWCGIRRG